MPPLPKLRLSEDLLICTACGAQYEETESSNKSACRICDDPRQFVPPTGQSFTTFRQMSTASPPYRNCIEPCEFDPDVYEIWTEPKFAIGERACLIKTPKGNVLWDLMTYLDEETFERIMTLGGISLIVISHPHFYTAWADWSATFQCPVYMSEVDANAWANRTSSTSLASTGATLRLLKSQHTPLPGFPGLTAIRCGGHFPGSMVLHSSTHFHSQGALFIADTLLAVPSAHNPHAGEGRPGVTSYSFMWSIPNAIPLSPPAILAIWDALEDVDFAATYGVFAKGSNVRERAGDKVTLKERILESMKIAVRAMAGDEMAAAIFAGRTAGRKATAAA